MKKQLLTLAIHKAPKATILKTILQNNGINVYLENMNGGDGSEGIYVRIEEKDLSRALAIIEGIKPFNYKDKAISEIDDGRKRILVAVDFSSYSMKACQIAFHIAKRIDAKIKILHVYHNIYFPSHIPFADTLKDNPDEGLLDKARKQMLDLCYKIEKKITHKEWPSVNYSYSLREGLVDEEINEFIKEYKPALLVVGTKGESDDKLNMLGSVTADIIEMTDVPVLTVPDKASINSLADIKDICFLTSLNKRDMISFDHLSSLLVGIKDIKITLVHFKESKKQNNKESEIMLEGIKEFLLKKYSDIALGYELIATKDIDKAIKEYVTHSETEMIVLNTRRRNLLGRMFSPSVFRKILYQSRAVILILRG